MGSHLVALAIENGATLHSADRDFARFPGLRWSIPSPGRNDLHDLTASHSQAECIIRDMADRKSVLLSLVLTFFFGPFGMLYSTVPGALVMLVLYVALGIVTLGWALTVLHPIAMIWGAVAADRANR